MKKIVLLVIMVVMVVLNVDAFNPTNRMKEANTSYAKNDFDQAIKQYLSIIDSGYVSANLYFNLGNSFYKTKNIKKAILYYERAKLMSPADKDIEFNLSMARNNTVDKIEAMPELFILTWLKSIEQILSENNWAKLSILAFVLSLAMFLVYLLSKTMAGKKWGFYLGILFLCVTLFSFISGYTLKENQNVRNTAIVFTPTVTAKSSPSESGNNLFILHEGTKIELLYQVGKWSEIKIADGSRGWIKTSDFEII